MVRDDGVVKILDFGIARRANAPVDPLAATEVQGLATITREGMVIGTNGYMSPEQLRAQSLDGRSDQFAWGVTAFELFSGASPWWPAVDTLQVVIAVLTGPTPDLAKSASDLPSGLASIIERTLAKVAADRFDTLDAVADALANLGEIPTIREQNAAENSVKPRMTPTVAATVLADPRSESERVPTQTPTVERRPKTVRPWHVFAALSGVCVAGWLGWLGWLGMHARRSQAQQQTMIRATPEVPDAQPIPSIALRHLCPSDPADTRRPSCPDGTRAWCDQVGARLACCAAGLVPIGTDGVCACAPGGVGVLAVAYPLSFRQSHDVDAQP